ncbi:C2H2-like zinc finger protein [Euphorbia peplus]|nr:C2H2-like zinc finger protein [Euphorbia peplus]
MAFIIISSQPLVIFVVIFFLISLHFFTLSSSSSSSSSSPSTPPLQDSQDFAPQRTLENAHQVHCSRERSRAAWKIIQEYLMPFVDKEHYKISPKCRLHPHNDIYRDQEQHKIHGDGNDWRCGFCRKAFYDEFHLDKHFENRHSHLLNTSESKCLGDLCGALHCDLVMDSAPRKKCNPAAVARNKHLCESLAGSCFPVNQGPSAHRLNEIFLRQFCDAHTCSRRHKPFPKGGKKRTSKVYIILSVMILMLLSLFYAFLYLYRRGFRRGSQVLRRISKGGQKKKPT